MSINEASNAEGVLLLDLLEFLEEYRLGPEMSSAEKIMAAQNLIDRVRRDAVQSHLAAIAERYPLEEAGDRGRSQLLEGPQPL